MKQIDPISALREAEEVIKKLNIVVLSLLEENHQLREQLGLGPGSGVIFMSIDELEFSVRTHNRIIGLKNVKGILEYDDWKSIKGFGEKSAQEVCRKLKELGLADKIPKSLADIAKL